MSIAYVYAIQHNQTKKIYIGSSVQPRQRVLQHIYALKKGAHSIEDMQNDFDEFGNDYSFFILEKVEDEKSYDGRLSKLHLAEYTWMDKLNTIDREIGYNYADSTAIRSISNMHETNLVFQDGTPTPIGK